MCWMLTVVMTAMPASRISRTSSQRFSWRPEPGHVGVGQLVDQDHLGLAGQDGVDVHLLPVRVAVLDLLSRHDREVADLLHRCRAACASRRTRPRRRRRAGSAATPRRAWRTSCPRRPPRPGRPGTCPVGRTPSSSPVLALISTSSRPGPATASVHSESTLRRTESCDARQTKRAGYQGNVPAHRSGRSSSRWPASARCWPCCCPSGPTSASTIPALVFVLPALVGRRHRRLPARRGGRTGRLPRLRLLLPPPLQHADRPLAPELDRARRLRRRRARSSPRSWPSCAAPGRRRAPDRGVRTAVRAVAGAHRRPHAVAAADAHRRHGAGRLRAALDGARPARGRERRPGCRSRVAGGGQRRGNR